MSTAALYARVSTRDKQETENQLMQLREFAAKQGWKTLEYIDRVTGKHSDRERFQQLFQDASQRKFDVVLFWSLDRFSREGVRETLNGSVANRAIQRRPDRLSSRLRGYSENCVDELAMS